MSESPKLPTREQQEQAYHDARLEFERKTREWEEGGRMGPRPSRPVPPHTPGWKLSERDEFPDIRR